MFDLDDDDVTSPVLGRRDVLRSSAALGLLSVMFGRMSALGRFATEVEAGDLDVSDLLDDARLQAVCTLMPSQTQGPFYLNLNLLRQDITEGKPGLRTRLWMNVVRASDCMPIPNAVVDVWHADAMGVYSGFASQGTAGQTYLRGIQVTDSNGQAQFDTIFPGWYPGRTAHIHVKARPSGGATLTSQMYFTQGLINRVYSRSPYTAHGPAGTTNAQDGFYDPLTRMSLLGYVQGVLNLEFTIGLP